MSGSAFRTVKTASNPFNCALEEFASGSDQLNSLILDEISITASLLLTFPDITERCSSGQDKDDTSTTVPGDGRRVIVVKISNTARGNNLKSRKGKTDEMDKTAVADATKAAALLDTWVVQGQSAMPVSGHADAWPKHERHVATVDVT